MTGQAVVMKNLIIGLILGVIFSLIVGCEQNQDLSKLAEDASSIVQSNVERLKEELPSHNDISKLSKEEIEKILSFEYKVFDYETPPTTAALEAKLNQLGLERWECIATPAFDKPVRIQCKRPAKLFLRYALSRLF